MAVSHGDLFPDLGAAAEEEEKAPKKENKKASHKKKMAPPEKEAKAPERKKAWCKGFVYFPWQGAWYDSMGVKYVIKVGGKTLAQQGLKGDGLAIARWTGERLAIQRNSVPDMYQFARWGWSRHTRKGLLRKNQTVVTLRLSEPIHVTPEGLANRAGN